MMATRDYHADPPGKECWGCIDLYDPADPPEVRVEGWMAVPGCPAHDPDGEPPFSPDDTPPED